MPQKIPLATSVPSFRIGVTLTGDQYLFDVRWNDRAKTWFMDLLDVAASPIASGLALVLGAWPGRRSADARFPRGAFYCVDTSGEGRDAGFDDLNARVELWFATFDELAAMAAG